jgi:hypothetical protein
MQWLETHVTARTTSVEGDHHQKRGALSMKTVRSEPRTRRHVGARFSHATRLLVPAVVSIMLAAWPAAGTISR